MQQQRAIAQLLDQVTLVGDQHIVTPAARNRGSAPAAVPERRVAHREGLVDEQHLRLDVGRDREPSRNAMLTNKT